LRRLQRLPIGAAFDEIYRRGIWSQSKDEPSGGGSYGDLADRYVAAVLGFIQEQGVRSVLDIGCGDFNIGARIAPHVHAYYAYDVSAEIISRNRQRFAELPNVAFRCANACSDELPRADLVTIRQVLQHLTNTQIGDILRNLDRTGAPHVLVTEHALDFSRPDALRPNLDLPSHSAGTRISLGSCVDLSAAPFLRTTRAFVSFPLQAGPDDRGERLETISLTSS